jgi:hypothetical protein
MTMRTAFTGYVACANAYPEANSINKTAVIRENMIPPLLDTIVNRAVATVYPTIAPAAARTVPSRLAASEKPGMT